MAFRGFQEYSGPAQPPSAQVKFGSDAASPPPSSNTPSFNSSPPLFPPSPPHLRSPPSGTGEAFRPQSSPPSVGNPPIVDVSYPLNRAPRPNGSGLTWENRQNGSGDKNMYSYQRLSTPSTSRTVTQVRNSGLQELGQFRSQSFLANDRETFGNYNSARKLSPPKVALPPTFVNHQSNIQSLPPGASQSSLSRPTSSPAIGVSRSRSPVSYADLPGIQEPLSISLKTAAYSPPRGMPLKISSRMNSPPVPTSKKEIRNGIHNYENLLQRPSVSTAIAPAVQTEPFTQHAQIHRIDTPLSRNNDPENFDVSRPSLPKRNRSPPPAHLKDRELQELFNSTQSDADRETQAKAKRMARFKVELREDDNKRFDTPFQKLSGPQPLNSAAKMDVVLNEYSDEGTRRHLDDNSVSVYEVMESTNAIIGLCPDMCPESERAERERKGDLDQYERLDGDRNQTDKSLAVKKYTRTAEREAILIRPMPILEKTIQYLLSLLDNPYDDKFLGMYNFLWDRMRAIRMDLRMQHIFNRGAITMLEQMIRLHILAMHELCEYTKGEGFSEGFDAHLNIEQMNKTSVELFQMYDDHRKKGIDVPTEKEFRGYYALLKLDKHPGYKVEPAELSLDLAKMTSELRQKPEILFAREVARACRTGNFVAFFRLAKKATYLQACLMHAHFAKLRTQALAALHSGLLTGQGIPVSQISQWLGLEEDDVVSLLEYHGFSIKDFDVPYMVKEGPMLNSDKDYPTKCSNLVHLKKSRSIVDDIVSSKESIPEPNNGKKVLQPHKSPQEDYPAVQVVKNNSLPRVFDVNMIDQKPVSAKDEHLLYQVVKDTQPINQEYSSNNWVPSVTVPTWSYPSTLKSSPANHIAKESQITESFHRDSPKRSVIAPFGPPSPKAMVLPSQVTERSDILKSPSEDMHLSDDSLEPPAALESSETDYVTESPQLLDVSKFTETNYDEEVAEAKLKLVIRMWRRRALKKRDMRERRMRAANAALNSLSLGLPFRSSKHVPSTLLDFNINHIVRERYVKREKSWTPLNVSEVVAEQLCERNPEASCLCFKLIICSQMNDKDIRSGNPNAMTASSWLHSKLIPERGHDDENLLVLSPDMAVWSTWVPNDSRSDAVCCVSVVRDVKSEDSSEEVTGANAVLFFSDDSISMERQRAHLQNLTMSLPSGSRLPLLILCGSYEADTTDSSASVARQLDLFNVDATRISEVHVMFLSEMNEREPSDGFHSTDQLMKALQWLASESLIQPILHSSELRDVVLNHLKSSVDKLTRMNPFEAGPEHYIAAFNCALDNTVQVIVEAAKSNPTGWPSPEISLLDDSSNERQACELYLPITGWSSPQKTEELVSALNNCKLPALQENLTWLHKGSHMGEDLEKHALLLEHCLIQYLTESANMLGVTLAKQEVRLLLQKNTRLELHDSTFYLVPDWAAIYQRIFNWQLMSIPRGKAWTVYLPTLQDKFPQISDSDTLMPDASIPSAYSLDEMVEEVLRIPEVVRPQLPNNQIQSATTSSSVAYDIDSTYAATDEEDRDISLLSRILPDTSSEMKAVAKREADRLSELLDSCNILQNSISKKLSLYF